MLYVNWTDERRLRKSNSKRVELPNQYKEQYLFRHQTAALFPKYSETESVAERNE